MDKYRTDRVQMKSEELGLYLTSRIGNAFLKARPAIVDTPMHPELPHDHCCKVRCSKGLDLLKRDITKDMPQPLGKIPYEV